MSTSVPETARLRDALPDWIELQARQREVLAAFAAAEPGHANIAGVQAAIAGIDATLKAYRWLRARTQLAALQEARADAVAALNLAQAVITGGPT